MKIFIIIDHWLPNVGGGPTQVYELAKRLVKYPRVSIEVITSRMQTVETSMIKPKTERSFKLTYLKPSGNYWNPFKRIYFMANLFFYLIRNDFDILHVHPYTPLIIAKIIGLLKHRPVVVTIHTMGEDAVGISFLDHLLQKIDRWFSFKVTYDQLIFVDKNLLDSVVCKTPKIFIPNGVDLKKFDDIKNITSKFINLLFVGRLHAQKNLNNLLCAFKIVNEKWNQTRLLIVGDGPERKHLLRNIEKLSLNSSTKLYGVLTGKKLVKIYKKSNAFILPSKYEGFPLTLLEAWAAKLPVAVTPVGQCRVLVEDGVNGFISQGFDCQSLAKMLTRVSQSKRLRAMGWHGYKSVAEKFSWDKAAEKTYTVYENISHQHE